MCKSNYKHVEFNLTQLEFKITFNDLKYIQRTFAKRRWDVSYAAEMGKKLDNKMFLKKYDCKAIIYSL